MPFAGIVRSESGVNVDGELETRLLHFAHSEAAAFVEPSGDPTNHYLHRPPKQSKPYCTTRSAVAMGTGAVRNEDRFRRIVHQLGLYYFAVWQIDRARHMAPREQRRTAHIKQHESGGAACERAGDIGAISLELQRRAEVGKRGCAVGRRSGGDGVGSRHV